MNHTGQCKSTGGCYNELVVAIFRTGAGVKGKKNLPIHGLDGKFNTVPEFCHGRCAFF